MGRPMVDRLVDAGHDVTIHCRRPEAQQAAAAEGLSWASTVTETVSEAEVVFCVVLTDEQVRSVCLGPQGALASMKAGSVLVQHTTSDPGTAQFLADEGGPGGIRVLDAAVSGGPHNVAAASLTLWVGGDEIDLDELRPLLAAYASPIMHVGPLGNGQRVKLVNNALFVAQVGLAIDAVRLAGSLGIEERAVLTAIQSGSGSSRGLDVVARGESVASIPRRLGDLMLKDLNVVRQVATGVGADLGIIGTVLSSAAVQSGVLGLLNAGEEDPP
jgi:3-hydroxyisobutyrate dehydrogenase